MLANPRSLDHGHRLDLDQELRDGEGGDHEVGAGRIRPLFEVVLTAIHDGGAEARVGDETVIFTMSSMLPPHASTTARRFSKAW